MEAVDGEIGDETTAQGTPSGDAADGAAAQAHTDRGGRQRPRPLPRTEPGHAQAGARESARSDLTHQPPADARTRHRQARAEGFAPLATACGTPTSRRTICTSSRNANSSNCLPKRLTRSARAESSTGWFSCCRAAAWAKCAHFYRPVYAGWLRTKLRRI